MCTEIPSSESLRQDLRGLTFAQIEHLALRSGVPFGTLYKIRNGHTPNPGIETVRKFYSHIPACSTHGEFAADQPAHGSSTNDPQASQRAEQGVANA